MKRIVIDLDHTICVPRDRADQTEDRSMIYVEARPNVACIERMREYRQLGFEIVVFTSRNMRTFAGDLDKIREHTLPIIVDWLARHDVPYDEIVIGKYWCGEDGFYVDDRAIRPSEFSGMAHDEIAALLKAEREKLPK